MKAGERRLVGCEATQEVPVLPLEGGVGQRLPMLCQELGGAAVERAFAARQRGVEGCEHATHPDDLLACPGGVPVACPHRLQDAAVEGPASGWTVGIDGARAVEAGAGLPEPALGVEGHRDGLVSADRHRPEQRAVAAEPAGQAEILRGRCAHALPGLILLLVQSAAMWRWKSANETLPPVA